MSSQIHRPIPVRPPTEPRLQMGIDIGLFPLNTIIWNHQLYKQLKRILIKYNEGDNFVKSFLREYVKPYITYSQTIYNVSFVNVPSMPPVYMTVFDGKYRLHYGTDLKGIVGPIPRSEAITFLVYEGLQCPFHEDIIMTRNAMVRYLNLVNNNSHDYHEFNDFQIEELIQYQLSPLNFHQLFEMIKEIMAQRLYYI